MLVYLEISTWQGISIGAIHYYGSIIASHKVFTKIPLMRKITKTVRAELARQDGGEKYASLYPIGSETERWKSEAALKRAAVAYFKQHYSPDTALLIEGSSSRVEPQPVLCGPAQIKAKINRLYREAVKCDFWDDEEKMTRICDEWTAVIKPYR